MSRPFSPCLRRSPSGAALLSLPSLFSSSSFASSAFFLLEKKCDSLREEEAKFLSLPGCNFRCFRSSTSATSCDGRCGTPPCSFGSQEPHVAEVVGIVFLRASFVLLFFGRLLPLSFKSSRPKKRRKRRLLQDISREKHAKSKKRRKSGKG